MANAENGSDLFSVCVCVTIDSTQNLMQMLTQTHTVLVNRALRTVYMQRFSAQNGTIIHCVRFANRKMPCYYFNKKVLLRERKKAYRPPPPVGEGGGIPSWGGVPLARGVPLPGGVPPAICKARVPPGQLDGVPPRPAGWGTPPSQLDGVPPRPAGWGTPPASWMGYPPPASWMGYPPPASWMGYPPPRCELTDKLKI